MRYLTTVAALAGTFVLAACGTKPSSPPATAPTSSADAGTTNTTSGQTGPVDEPNSPSMTNSGTPNPPGRGVPPQIMPPEIAPQ